MERVGGCGTARSSRRASFPEKIWAPASRKGNLIRNAHSVRATFARWRVAVSQADPAPGRPCRAPRRPIPLRDARAARPEGRSAFGARVSIRDTAYTLVQFHWFRRFVLDDRSVPPRAPSTGRQNVFVRLLAAARERETLPFLAEVAEGLAAAIAKRWPDAADMPLYPAFR